MIAILRIIALFFVLPNASAIQVGMEQKQQTKFVGKLLGALAPKSTAGKVALGAAGAFAAATAGRLLWNKFLGDGKMTAMGAAGNVASSGFSALKGLASKAMGTAKFD
jgi:hypothetical protein